MMICAEMRTCLTVHTPTHGKQSKAQRKVLGGEMTIRSCVLTHPPLVSVVEADAEEGGDDAEAAKE